MSRLKPIVSEVEDRRQFSPGLTGGIEGVLAFRIHPYERAGQADGAGRSVVSVRVDGERVRKRDLKHLVSADWEVPRAVVS